MRMKKANNKWRALRRGRKFEAQKSLRKTSGGAPEQYLDTTFKDTQVSETFQLTNIFTINNGPGGTWDNYVLLDNQAILNNSGMLINDVSNSTPIIDNSGVLNNLAGGQLKNDYLINNTGTLNNSGTINNNGTLDNVLGGRLALLAGSTLNNSGTLVSDYSSSFQTAANSSILNTGTMAFSGNTVIINGSLRNDGTINLVGVLTTVDDMSFVEPAPPLLITSHGKLSGTGTVTGVLFPSGVVVDGVMSPGDLGGTFTINGYYTQGATGIMDILLGGTGAGQFGQLDVTGAVDLGGVLDVELFGGFDPQSGEKFEFLESGGITGDFANLIFPTLGDGLFFKLDQEGNNLFLDVMGGSGGGGGGGTMPTPESSSLLLLASALAGLGCLALRKRQNGFAV